MRTNKVEIVNRFYVGSEVMTTPGEQSGPHLDASEGGGVCGDKGYTSYTLEGAVKKATRRLAKDTKLEHVAIVKIVAIVRRADLPVIVEMVP